MSGYVVVIEGLATSLIGAYGSNVGRTPTWDKLASQGITLDQCFVDSLQLSSQLGSLWSGRHTLSDDSRLGGFSTLWQDLNEQLIPNRLLTDCEQVAQLAEQLGCQDVTYVPPPVAEEPASSLDNCVALQLFFAAAETLRSHDEPQEGLTWIHSSGMRLPWDVPLEIRNTFVDPEDPDPPQSVDPPCFRVDGETDPDLVVGWGQVAAAQATVFDEGLALLLTAAQDPIVENPGSTPVSDETELQDQSPTDRSIEPEVSVPVEQGPLKAGDSWVVVGMGGCALGEHGLVGQMADVDRLRELGVVATGAEQLHGESLSCAALLIPGAQVADADATPARRRPELLQLPDLGESIRGMLGLEAEQDRWGQDVFELGFADSPSRWKHGVKLTMIETPWGIWGRCPAWSIQIPRVIWEQRWQERLAAGDALEQETEVEQDSLNDELSPSEQVSDAFKDVATSCRLFVQPEDRWEVSDIADRRPDVVAELTRILVEFRNAVNQGDRSKVPILPDELLSLMR